MATDFTNNNKTISTSGGLQPTTINTPLDVRTRVNSKADIDSIPNPFVGMKILVLQDETNNNEMTEYIVVSLKADSLGIENAQVNEVVLMKDFLGINDNGNGKNNIVESFNFSPNESGQISLTIPYIAQAGEALKITIASDNEGEIETIYCGINTDSGEYIQNQFIIPFLGIPRIYIPSYNIEQIVLWSNQATIGTYTMTIERIVQSSSLNYSFSIFGDSISTFEGWIPENNATWYPSENNNVKNVENTWWKQLSDKNGMKLLVNNSYSGSSLCTTGYGEGEGSTRISFVTRIKENTSGETPDIIFIQGGTNDVWGGCPLGSELFLDYTEYTENDLKQVIPAFCYIVDYLKTFNPNSKIVYIQMPDVLGSNFSKGIMKACLHYDIECIFFEELTSQGGHPDIEGMNTIYERVIADLCSNEFKNISSYAKKTDLLTNVSQLTNDAGYVTDASVDEKVANAFTNEITELNILSLVLGNYQIKYNSTDGTLDFLYNGVIDVLSTPEEPTTGVISLSWIDNRNIDYKGVENDDTSAMVTDYLTKEDGYNYTINLTDVSSVKVYFFGSSKTFISRTDNLTVDSTDTLIEFPENTVYFRIKSDKGIATVDNANDYIILKKVAK